LREEHRLRKFEEKKKYTGLTITRSMSTVVCATTTAEKNIQFKASVVTVECVSDLSQ
jgi:phage regulator Rha-like protein